MYEQLYPFSSCLDSMSEGQERRRLNMALQHNDDDIYSPIPVDLSEQWQNIPLATYFNDIEKSNSPCPTMSDSSTSMMMQDYETENSQEEEEIQQQKKTRPFVDHTYVDFSLVNDERIFRNKSCQISGETLQSILTRDRACEPRDIVTVQTNSTNRSVETFPMKLMDLLSKEDTSECIAWLPHGRSFRVDNTDLFMMNYSPRIFKATKYRSFVRQLNIWGFKRITCGVDMNSYYHPMFLRGKTNLVMKMTRKKGKLGCKPRPNPDEEPDFLLLSMLRPLP